MFRDSPAEKQRSVLSSSIGLLIAIVIATGMNIWLVLEIRKEQRAVEAILDGGVKEDIQRLGSLPVEMRWQLLFSIIVLIVLLIAAATLVFVVRAYLRSQAILGQTQMLGRDILASIDYGLITTDTQGQVTSANRQAHELLRVTSDPVGRALEQLSSLIPLAEICRQVSERNEPVYDRSFTLSEGDRQRMLSVDCHSLQASDQSPRGLVWHIRDLTQQVLLQQRMRRMERFLNLGTLAAGLHHEIKNPLTALSLHVQLLEEAWQEQADQPTMENLNILKTEVTRIAGVLESFRDFASSEDLHTTPLALRDIVAQTVSLLAPQAQQRQIAVTVESADGLPPVQGDPIRLEQVVLNLAINALESMQPGGTLSLRITGQEQYVVLDVADTGSGVPDDIQDYIMDPYFTTKNSGSGMGLAFCDKIVRQHGGQVTYDTGPQGTVFHVALPAVENE